jgi:putative metalloprotease
MSILVFSLTQAVAPASGSRVHGREPAQAAAQKNFDAKTAQRLYRITTPLLRAMEHSLKPQQVSVGIVADDAINAANGGGGKFIVTTGLLERANDDQLRGIMAHEIAHEDLGHVTKFKLSATGVNMILLKQLATEGTALSLIEGPLITLSFSPSEESQADRQSVAILDRAGYPREVVIEALIWMAKSSAGSGNFVSSHPNIGERIKTLQAMPK